MCANSCFYGSAVINYFLDLIESSQIFIEKSSLQWYIFQIFQIFIFTIQIYFTSLKLDLRAEIWKVNPVSV